MSWNEDMQDELLGQSHLIHRIHAYSIENMSCAFNVNNFNFVTFLLFRHI